MRLFPNFIETTLGLVMFDCSQNFLSGPSSSSSPPPPPPTLFSSSFSSQGWKSCVHIKAPITSPDAHVCSRLSIHSNLGWNNFCNTLRSSGFFFFFLLLLFSRPHCWSDSGAAVICESRLTEKKNNPKKTSLSLTLKCELNWENPFKLSRLMIIVGEAENRDSYRTHNRRPWLQLTTQWYS